ncbi:MAG: hypothetical protein RLT87_11855 [Gammaproteobacteria bacterium]
MRRLENKDYVVATDGLESRTIGDSRGYLWKIIIDKNRAVGRIEKLSGLRDNPAMSAMLDGTEYPLPGKGNIRDDMQHLTSIIESRFHAA